eukprot:TRINITY_DN3053_c0_g1_i3.p1 TRINITY_DN3053_c0_g1~~TRINITY_DN3053_c0_g1_i3.p1  ORF type:complete len:384 (+),score=51.84 TRINITY_DN3053_c0_g1_i3:135-1154(+)
MDSVTYGLIGSCYGLAQFIFNPVMGTISDKYGRKNLLLLSFVGSAISYLMLGMATVEPSLSVPVLLISRLLVGVVKQTMTLAQALISDETSEEDRVKGLATVSTAVGMGFVIGPSVGSFLQSSFGPLGCVLVSSLLYVIDFILVYKLFPNNVKRHGVKTSFLSDNNGGEAKSGDEKDKQGTRSFLVKSFVNQFKEVWYVLKIPTAGPLLVNRFLRQVSTQIPQSNIGLMLMDHYGLTSVEIGYFLSFSGLLGVLSASFVGFISQRFEKTKLIWICTLIVIAADLLFITPMVDTLTGYLILMPFNSLSHSLLSTINLAKYTNAFNKNQVGLALGVSGSVG